MPPVTPQIPEEAFVTLVTNDAYALGALVLAHSLLDAGTHRTLAVIISTQVSQSTRNQLADVFNVVQPVEELNSNDAASLALLGRPELGVTLTKIYCWKLTNFRKAVFLDADTLVIRNIDDLFERPEIAAAPDVGWPDCFNSGVFVFVPSNDTFEKLAETALREGTFDGGDQGLLNQFFSSWASSQPEHRLSFLYNMNANIAYSYLPAFSRFGDQVKVIHFIGAYKPWHWPRDDSGNVYPIVDAPMHSAKHVQLWWSVFDRHFNVQKPPVNLSSLPYGFQGEVRRVPQPENWGLAPRVNPVYHQQDAAFSNSAPFRPYDFSIISRKLDSIIPNNFANQSISYVPPRSPSHHLEASAVSKTEIIRKIEDDLRSVDPSEVTEILESLKANYSKQ